MAGRHARFGVSLFVFLCALAMGHRNACSQTSTNDGFRLALPGYTFSFPRDHAAHPDFKTEWWYFTGHLAGPGDSKPRFGYELTFFRTAVSLKNEVPQSAWGMRDIYFAHFAISDLKGQKFWHTEKISRGALDLAGASTNSVHVWIEKWKLNQVGNNQWEIFANESGNQLQLSLLTEKPEAVHGSNGVSIKGPLPGQASHYVSFTRMKSEGSMKWSSKEYQVMGTTWYDHEFGSNQLAKDQVGWDWFSLQLDSGEELMVYLLRKENGCFETTSSGSWIDRAGKVTHLDLSQISVLSRDHWTSPHTKVVYPTKWEIRIPSKSVNVVVEPSLADQELVNKETGKMAYWEGACSVSGSHIGRAYVELTGYDHSFKSSPLQSK